MPPVDHKQMQDCIETAWLCRATCQKTLFNYCLEKGGHHTAPEHVKTMIDCIAICQTAADFMTRRSQYHAITCRACADICAACAKSCSHMTDDPVMQECAAACKRCALSCEDMIKANTVSKEG